MGDKINEQVLCVLRNSQVTNQIEIEYVDIENPLLKPLKDFENLCEKNDSTLEQIAQFIRNTTELNQLTALYRYCESLSGSYQAFTVNNQDTIAEINNREKLILLNKELEPEKYNSEEKIEEFKQELSRRYRLWGKAYAINKTYRLCYEDKSILTFSHRIDGWSNPVYQLTPNFSVEIRTNFGYGRASYFYTKLKYKNIEITPFSEWIDYEFAKFSEIVRYTRSHLLANEYWLEAMEFSKDACNLSKTDENKFVEKYIIEECDKMASGLEEIFNIEQFSFKSQNRIHYSVDKKGHILIEFRGEKISGALDFISKIIEFEKITSIKSFIERIEACNKKIQPILISESKVILLKLNNLNAELSILKPKYLKVLDENNLYSKKRLELQNQMIISEQLDPKAIDSAKLNVQFDAKYPEYAEFIKEYRTITESHRLLTEQIRNLTNVYNNIITYNEKIVTYFEK